MKDLLPFIVAGLVSGSVYGLVASGLVLTYKTSGILNFGHGAIATAAAYVFYWLHVGHGWDWKPSAAVAVLLVGPLFGYLMQTVSSSLSRQRVVWRIVGTLGLVLIVQGLGTIKYGQDALQVAPFLPGSGRNLHVLGVIVTWGQILVIGISIVAAAALFVFFARSRSGYAMRAVVDDAELLDMTGTSATQIRALSWLIGATFAALSGVLIVPFVGLDPITLTFLVVSAFGAAAIGLFSSIPRTFLGGLILGVLATVPVKWVTTHPGLAGLPDSVPFIVLIIVLLATPRRRLDRVVVGEFRTVPEWHGTARQRIAGFVVVLAGLCFVPAVVGIHLAAWTTALTQMVLFLSLGLLVRTAGQVSLCHMTFAAIGATTFSQLTVNVGLPWLLALLLAALIVVPIGALVAIPALRLSGAFLAVATLGFGIMVERLFYPTSFMFTSIAAEGRLIPRPSFGSSDVGYYYVVLAFVVVVGGIAAWLNAGRLGRLLRGISESPLAAATFGLSVPRTRLLVFCISAFFAAIAGILYGGEVHFASTYDSHYQSFTSVLIAATLCIVPGRDPWYAVIAGMMSIIPSYIPGEHTSYWLNVIFGVSAVLLAMRGGPHALPAAWAKRLNAASGVSPHREALAAPVQIATRRPQGTGDGDGTDKGLAVSDLVVRFGGLLAVDKLSLKAPRGRITGLIGPNGAGKTTSFNACSGILKPSAGQISVHGVNVTRRGVAWRARRGIGRTFQAPELCESLTVFENVALGVEAGQVGAALVRQIAASRRTRAERVTRTWDALERCNVAELADRQVGDLSTGMRRRVELARCLAGEFDFLLLDEPSSGLDHDETKAFAETLVALVRDRGYGILLVEHDMSMVMTICDYIYVLDFGKLIFEGTSEQVTASPIVRSAYLGEDVAYSGDDSGVEVSVQR